MNWIDVKDRLPKSGQDVLVCISLGKYIDDVDMEILTYYNKGDRLEQDSEYLQDPKLTPDERLLEAIFDTFENDYAPADGFYIYDDVDGQGSKYRLHRDDLITHWRPLPKSPKNERDNLDAPITVNIKTYYEVRNATVFGGVGSEGYMCSIDKDLSINKARLIFGDAKAFVSQKLSYLAKDLGIAIADISIISKSHYAYMTEEDEDD